ncbi:MAG: DinB family protein [Caldilineaceae bacterium]
MNPISFIFRTVMRFQTRGKSLDELVAAAAASGQNISHALADKADTPENRKQLRHIIGIERWGQRRLQTLLGEPLLQDEYDGYQPAESLDFQALRAEFAQTRQTTLDLVRTLQQKGVAETGQALHNGMGEVPVTIWVRYLTMHANFEHTRIK